MSSFINIDWLIVLVPHIDNLITTNGGKYNGSGSNNARSSMCGVDYFVERHTVGFIGFWVTSEEIKKLLCFLIEMELMHRIVLFCLVY